MTKPVSVSLEVSLPYPLLSQSSHMNMCQKGNPDFSHRKYLTNCFKYSHGYINVPFYESFAYALRDSGRIQVTHIFKKNWVRSSRLDVFYKKGVPRNLAKITGKHLSQSFFLIKLQV